MLPAFNVQEPTTIEQLFEIMEEEDLRIIAGGTDLLIDLKNRNINPQTLVDITNISELKRWKKTENTVTIGAALNLFDLVDYLKDSPQMEALYTGAKNIGSTQIRSLATIGGNICNASPAADTIPALIVLNANLILTSKNNERKVNIENFFTGPNKNILKRNEILKEIKIPIFPDTHTEYIKFSPRGAMDIATVSSAVLLNVNQEGIIKKARLALGAVSATPLPIDKVKEYLIGEKLDKKLAEKCGEIAMKESEPITDFRASEGFRRNIVKTLTRDALLKCYEKFNH